MSELPVSHLTELDNAALQALVLQLSGQVQRLSQDNHYKETRIQQLTHEIAILKRYRYGKKSERLSGEQGVLFDDAVDADLAAIEQELVQLGGKVPTETPEFKPKRQALPPELPRTEIRHEPDNTTCQCGCQMQRIGQDVSEKLDYEPGTFMVQCHIRGKWACRQCETITQAPVPAQVIDKGLATEGLLAQVLVAKYADHLPLYRQETIYARAGVQLSRSTMAEWVGVCGVRLQPLVDALRAEVLMQPVLHADETPVRVLKPGSKTTHRGYLWAYAPGVFEDLRAVVYDFTDGRAGSHARIFLGAWQGSLICDDYGGYKASFGQGVTEVGCMAHARRKFYELHQSGKSQIAEQALASIQALYAIESQAKNLTPQARQQLRQEQARPLADALHAWLLVHREKVPGNSGISKAWTTV